MKRPCLVPRCPDYAIPTGKGRCRRHARERERSINRAGKSVYGTKRWEVLRKRVLFEQPLCACGCGELSTDVDHIVPISQGGQPYARANVQALAHECHAKKTRREQLYATSGAGWPD